MSALLLGEPVANGGGDYGEHPGVLRNPLLLGFPFDQRGHVAGNPQVLLDRLTHSRDGTASATIVAGNKAGPARLQSPGPMAKETELPMQAQGIRPNDFRFGTQKDAVALAAKAVRRRGWDLSNNGVWEWLAGLAEGATSAGRAEFAERSVVREFARYLVALNSSADCGKADRLSNEVARAARSEIAALGSYAQQDGAES